MTESRTGVREPPTDRTSRRFLQKLPRMRPVAAARDRGLIGDDNPLVAGVCLDRHSGRFLLPLALLGGIPVLPFLLFIQKRCFVLVTPGEVIVTRFYPVGRHRKAVEQALRLPRPVRLELDAYPLPRQMTGQKVRLPPDVEAFVGTARAWVVLGDVAEYAFSLARTPPADQ